MRFKRTLNRCCDYGPPQEVWGWAKSVVPNLGVCPQGGNLSVKGEI